jgi:hypothetical protein
MVLACLEPLGLARKTDGEEVISKVICKEEAQVALGAGGEGQLTLEPGWAEARSYGHLPQGISAYSLQPGFPPH